MFRLFNRRHKRLNIQGDSIFIDNADDNIFAFAGVLSKEPTNNLIVRSSPSLYLSLG